MRNKEGNTFYTKDIQCALYHQIVITDVFMYSNVPFALKCLCVFDFEPNCQQRLNTNDATDSILTSRKLKEYVSVRV